MILQRGGPLSATVDSTLLQVVLRRIGETVKDIADGLPVLQVLRGHHGCARHQVHGGAYEIEGVAHADHVGIGNVCPQHGILNGRGVDGLVVLSESRREERGKRKEEREYQNPQE